MDNKTDPFEAGAREKLEKYVTRTECPAALADAQQKIKDIDDRINDAQAQLKKLGCYAVEPSSARFDKETQDAVGRFQRWAHLSVDQTHLTTDLVQKLAAFTGEGACPALAPPPPVAALPSEKPALPREQPKPVRPKREPVESAESAPVRHTAPAPRPAPAAPAAPAASSGGGGAKSQIFIPN